MIGDVSRAEHNYIVCGYTDMRKAIDGLAAIVQQNFKLDVFPAVCSCSAVNAVTVSRRCCGKRTDLCCCIKGLKMENTNDRIILMKQDLFHSGNSDG